MTDETYNGWTNKATWLVKLWIDNDQNEQEFWLESAREAEDILQLEEWLRESFEEAGADKLSQDSGFWTDLLMWALASVNWGEIAFSLKEDAAEIASA